MSGELEIKDRLIDEFKMLTRLRKLAEKAGATEVIEEIDREIHFIKLKLQPLELTDK